MNGKNSIRAKHLDFIIIDFICVLGSMWLAYLIWVPKEEKVEFFDNYRALSIVMMLAYFFIVFFIPVHSGILRRGKLKELEKIVIMNIGILAVMLGYLFVVKISYIYSRMVFGLFFAFDIVIMFIIHLIWKKILLKHYTSESSQNKCMIVTHRRYLDDFMAMIEKNNHGFYRIVGVILLDDEISEEDRGVIWRSLFGL